jgi:hypothetical protein
LHLGIPFGIAGQKAPSRKPRGCFHVPW